MVRTTLGAVMVIATSGAAWNPTRDGVGRKRPWRWWKAESRRSSIDPHGARKRRGI